MNPGKIFICYARTDNEAADPARRWLDRVLEHLRGVLRQEQWATFCDNDLRPGETWHERIQAELGAARAAVLLVSPAFLNSEYIKNHELPKLLGKRRDDGLRILPVFIRPSAVRLKRYRYPDPVAGPEELVLSSLLGVGTPDKCLASLRDDEVDAALVRLAEELFGLLQVEPPSPIGEPRAVSKPPRARKSPGTSQPPGMLRPAPSPTEGVFENSLGMRFVRVQGVGPWFSVWMTRLRDFRAFAEATGHDADPGIYSLDTDGWKQRGHTWRDPGFEQTDDHPVVGVSWEDAQAFCRWLTGKERHEGRLQVAESYRLPTDAEWSAAVGDGRYPWGADWPPPPDAGNYAGEESRIGKEPGDWTFIQGWRDGYPRTSPVGCFRPSRDGLYDLGGNAWEWCEDWYRKELNSVELRRDVVVLDDDGDGRTHRVLRGGSWVGCDPRVLLGACRDYGPPVLRIGFVGFRCVWVEGSRP